MATQLIALLKNQHGTGIPFEQFWLELLYAKKRKASESLQDLYQDIRRLISLACLNDASNTSERLAINQFTNALDNKNMRFEVLNKNPDTLETALHIALRYEALKPSQSAPQETTVAEPVKTTDMSAYVYDDKGRQKENLRVHKLHVAPDPLTDAKYEVERARNDEGQKIIIDLQRQLEGWKSWQDEQTRTQAAYASGTYYNQTYAPPKYPGPATQAAPYDSDTQATGYQAQNTNQAYRGKTNRGNNNYRGNRRGGAQQTRPQTQGSGCFTCGAVRRCQNSCQQNQTG